MQLRRLFTSWLSLLIGVCFKRTCKYYLINILLLFYQGELNTCLPILLDRLKNEITRLTTVKALTKVAASPLRIDLRPILGEAIPMLGSFLRKNQRALKLSTLTLLDVLVCSYHTSMSPQLLNKVSIHFFFLYKFF